MSLTQVRTWEGGHVRRLVEVVFAVFAAVFLVSFASLSAQAEPADRQYEPSGGSEATGNTPESTAPDDSGASGAGFVSQGSVGGETLEARATRRDLAEEERMPDYSQVVDNSTKGRFVAPGWERASGSGGSHGGDYALAKAGSDAKKATFRVKIPTDNDYGVYTWYTTASENASAARFVISSASGPHTEKVDQTKEGGMWIKLGTFEMKKGERTVKVSPSGHADVVADAVAIVRGTAAPPEETAFSAAGGDTLRASATYSADTGPDIVRMARKYKGTRYKYATCTKMRMSCTCETKKSVAHLGHMLPMDERGQWRYEQARRIRSKSNLLPGDIVFFQEEGGGVITHVGVYSGHGNLVQASSYYGKVVESRMKYVRGFLGAIRVTRESSLTDNPEPPDANNN
jgi:cell wall-associated NlpC family hydrolase